MKSRFKKIIAVLTIAVFIFAAFAACAEKAEDGIVSQNDEKSVGEEVENTPEESTEEAKLKPNLDDNANFGGHVFTVMTRTSTEPDWLDWIPRDIFAAEETGDPINDAVYKRNVYLEEKYNFKIEQIFSTNLSGDIKKAVGADDDMYGMMESNMRDAAGFAQNGYFVDLHEIPNLELTQPWWNQAANAALSFGGKLYFTSGDILLVNNDTCTGFVFNKDLLKDLGLDDPYPIVKSGKWTMDKLYDFCKGAARDLNGDGQMVYTDDRYGLIGQRDTLISFLHGANEYITKKDSNDYPYITFGGERSIAAMEACFKVMYEEWTHNAHHLEGKVPGIYPISEEMFMGDRALFMWVRLRIVENLRAMDTDFGILPIPKLDEIQDDYYTDVISYTGVLMCVPATVRDDSRTGHILEAICAESKYTTMPAYYDVTLKTKMARDEDSSEMLDIIFKNRVWDMGEISNYGEFGGQLIQMSMKNNSDIVSLFDKRLPAMEKAITKAIEAFDKLG